jgi:hypothetical protein
MRKLALLGLACIVSLFAQSQSDAALIQFNLIGKAGPNLLPGNEIHAVTSTGSGGEILGGIVFDNVTKFLSVSVGWGVGNSFSNLTGNVTLMHLHGPAGINASAGVLVDFVVSGGVIHSGVSGLTPSTLPFFSNSPTNGSFIGGVTLSSTNEQHLMAGLLYLNVHTTAFGPGEIRGNLAPVPEPSSMAIVGLGLIGFGVWKRRKKNEAN